MEGPLSLMLGLMNVYYSNLDKIQIGHRSAWYLSQYIRVEIRIELIKGGQV